MKVLTFGTFDGLHNRHLKFFQEAAKLGDELLVIGSRDSYIRHQKQREPRSTEQQRAEALEGVAEVDTVMLGNEWPNDNPYSLLAEASFDILAVGHDQQPSDEVIKEILEDIGKPEVKVIRLEKY